MERNLKLAVTLREQDAPREWFLITEALSVRNPIGAGSGDRATCWPHLPGALGGLHLFTHSYFTASLWYTSAFQNWFERFSIKKKTCHPNQALRRLHKAHKGDMISTGGHCERQTRPSMSKVTWITIGSAKWPDTFPVIRLERWYLLSLVVTDVKHNGRLLSSTRFHIMQIEAFSVFSLISQLISWYLNPPPPPTPTDTLSQTTAKWSTVHV